MDHRAAGGWVAVDDDGAVTGYVAVRPLPGWSDHVGEVRLAVSPACRGDQGLGRELARRALVEAVGAGLSKLVVEVVAEQGRRWRCSPTWGSPARRCSPITSATAAGSCAT